MHVSRLCRSLEICSALSSFLNSARSRGVDDGAGRRSGFQRNLEVRQYDGNLIGFDLSFTLEDAAHAGGVTAERLRKPNLRITIPLKLLGKPR
jgi:hypothetical protein